MLDISFSELLLIGFVALIALGPKELLATLKSFKKISSSLKKYYEDFTKYLYKELSENEDNYVKIIFDENGNPQKVYDLNTIKPYIKKNKKKKKI